MALSSDAGPSSGRETTQHGALTSLRQLYYTLEAASSPVAPSAVQARLTQVLPRLRSSCDASASSSSYPTLATGRQAELNANMKDIDKRSAALHQVSDAEMTNALQAYLDSEYTEHDGSSNPLLASLATTHSFAASSGRANKSQKRSSLQADATSRLGEALTLFYLEERLYALRCISALLRIGDDKYHDLHQISEETLQQFVDEDFALKCLRHMEVLCEQQFADEVRATPRFSTYWAKHVLREQLALLEVVFLAYYSRIQSSARFVQAVHKTIERTDFGRRHVSAGFYDVEAAALSDCVSHLLILLSVESLDVERLMDGLDFYQGSRAALSSSDADSHKQLIDSPEVVGSAIDFLRTSTARDLLRAPLLLAWSLFVSRVDTALSDWTEARQTEPVPEHLANLSAAFDARGGAGALWPEMASVALSPDLQLFATLNQVANSPLLSWDSRSSAVLALALPSSLAMRAVLKGLLLSVTELVRPEFVQDYAGLVRLWQNALANEDDVDHRTLGLATDSAAALCVQFWEVDYEFEHRRALLTTAKHRFPVSFLPLVGLCRALSGSGPGALHASDEALRASAAVYAFLASVDTLTHVLPPTAAISAAYEAVAGSQDASLYRAKRDIAVFGRHLVIPAGTHGRMISAEDQAAAIIVWDVSETPYSAWRLLRDVLAHFAGLLDRKQEFALPSRASRDDGDVFADQTVESNFGQLAPDECDTYDGDLAASAMDLFSSILATESSLPAALLAHLDGHDQEHRSSVIQPTAFEAKHPALVAVTFAILNQALATPSAASRVIISAYRLLTLSIATASHANEFWLPLRSSGLLIGINGSFSFDSRAGLTASSATTTLLAHEQLIGKFAGTLALLDFHHALLADVQQSCYSLSESDAGLRADILLRALRFVTEQVWPDYQDWKYVRIRQQIEVGQKCMRIFERILTDETLATASPATAQIRAHLENLLVAESASSVMLAPLLHMISSRNSFIDGLQKAMRLVEVELARDSIVSCLRLARIIVQGRRRLRRSKPSKGTAEVKFGHIERAFVEDLASSKRLTSTARRADRSMNLAGTTTSFIFSAQSHGVRCEAIKLLTAVCNALSDTGTAPAPALISHLGSLSDVEMTLTGLLNLAESTDEDAELRALTLNLLASFVSGQPGMATLLLTGKHVSSNPRQDESSRTTEEDKMLARTAVDVAIKLVQDGSRGDVRALQSNAGELRCLDAALRLLCVVWEHAIEHYAELEKWRQDKAFWKQLSSMSCWESAPFTTDPNQIDVDTGKCRTDRDDEVTCAALARTCSARALHVIATDVRLAGLLDIRNRRRAGSKNAPSRQTIWPSLDCVVDLLESKLQPVLEDALRVTCDPIRHADVLLRMQQTFPELSMDHFRIPARLDDFDVEKQYGSAYVYDVDTLRVKLDGLLSGASNEPDAVLQAVLLVAGVNLDWCAIDAQSMYLRALAGLFSAAIGPLFDHLETDPKLSRDVRQTIARVWVECARIAADEEASVDVMQDIHALRLSLLAVLLEMAWAEIGQKAMNRQLQHDYGEAEHQTALDVMTQAARLATHPVLSVEDAMRTAPLTAHSGYPRDVARIVLISSGHYRSVRRQMTGGLKDLLGSSLGGSGKAGEAERLRGMQRCAETLVSHTTTCMRVALDRCLAAVTSASSTASERDVEAMEGSLDLDLQLLAATLTLLLHPDGALSVHVWAPKMHTTALLQISLDLFSRTPLHRESHAGASIEDLASGVVPPFWQTLLDFFLDLASQPSTAEALILAGAMNAMSVNAISLALEGASASTVARLPSRLAANGASENALHGLWIKMLRVIVALISSLNAPHQLAFIQQEVTGFFQIFHPFLDACLDQALFDVTALGVRLRYGAVGVQKAGGTGKGSTDSLRTTDLVPLNQLQETEMVLRLYTHILRSYQHQIDVLRTDAFSSMSSARATGKDQEAHREQAKRRAELLRQPVERLVSQYTKRATLRLQEAVHLLQHPHELSALLGMDKASDGKVTPSPSTTLAGQTLLQVGISIIESFWLCSRGFDTLCSSDASEWETDNVLIAPTIGTSPSRPSSTGTLLDLASYLSDTLRSTDRRLTGRRANETEEVEDPSMMHALEQTLSFATVQLATAMHGRSAPAQPQMVREDGSAGRLSFTKSAQIQSIDVEAGLGRDVAQSTESAKSAIGQAAGRMRKDAGMTAYVDVLLAFQRRWLLTSA